MFIVADLVSLSTSQALEGQDSPKDASLQTFVCIPEQNICFIDLNYRDVTYTHQGPELQCLLKLSTRLLRT